MKLMFFSAFFDTNRKIFKLCDTENIWNRNYFPFVLPEPGPVITNTRHKQFDQQLSLKDYQFEHQGMEPGIQRKGEYKGARHDIMT